MYLVAKEKLEEVGYVLTHRLTDLLDLAPIENSYFETFWRNKWAEIELTSVLKSRLYQMAIWKISKKYTNWKETKG